jgi:hypothetical protein
MLYFFSFFVLFSMSARVRRTTKVPFFVVPPILGAWQSPLDAISSRRAVSFFAVRHT